MCARATVEKWIINTHIEDASNRVTELQSLDMQMKLCVIFSSLSLFLPVSVNVTRPSACLSLVSA